MFQAKIRLTGKIPFYNQHFIMLEQQLPEDMLLGVARNLCENCAEHQSFEERSQHLGCLETSYRPANLLSIPNVFYTKVPGEHHEQSLSCLQKVSGNC